MKPSAIPVASPVKPNVPVEPYADVPVARPITVPPHHQHHYVPPSSSASADENTRSFFLTALRLGIFHALNSTLGIVGFVVVVVGTVFSVALLPLCCFGIVTFRVMLFFVGFLAELDVSLYNFISPPQEHVYLSMPRQNHLFEFTGLRLAPNLSSFSPGSLLVSLYFVTIKFAIGMLSSIALSVTFSFPTTTFSDATMQDTFFANFIGFVGFLLITTLLFCLGAALMKFSAGVSRAATRYFCCEKFSTYAYVARANAYPTAVPTYGTTIPTNADADRVIV